MCYKTECSAVLITFKWLSTFVYLSFAERHLRGSHKGLTFNIISPSNNNFNECAYMHFSFWKISPNLSFRNILPELVLSTVYSCFCGMFVCFSWQTFCLQTCAEPGRRQKGEIESARTISTVQSLHTG